MAVAEIVTTGDLKDYLEVSGSGRDVRIDMIVEGVNAFVAEYTQRDFQTATRTEWHSGNGTDLLVLGKYPVQSLTSITEDGTVLDKDDRSEIEVDFKRGILTRVAGLWWSGREKKIQVVYEGGAPAPADVKLATLEIAAYVYRTAGGRETVGSGAASFGLFGGAISKLPGVKDTLAGHIDSARYFLSYREQA